MLRRFTVLKRLVTAGRLLKEEIVEYAYMEEK
jgi:hypothetical protein